MHWSKYLQPNLPSSKGSRASHGSRLRRYSLRAQSTKECPYFSGDWKVQFWELFLRCGLLFVEDVFIEWEKTQAGQVEVVPWRSRRMPGSWMWSWCGGQLFCQAPQPAQLLSSKEERASQCDRASGVALLEQVDLLLLLLLLLLLFVACSSCSSSLCSCTPRPGSCTSEASHSSPSHSPASKSPAE